MQRTASGKMERGLGRFSPVQVWALFVNKRVTVGHSRLQNSRIFLRTRSSGLQIERSRANVKTECETGERR